MSASTNTVGPCRFCGKPINSAGEPGDVWCPSCSKEQVQRGRVVDGREVSLEWRMGLRYTELHLPGGTLLFESKEHAERIQRAFHSRHEEIISDGVLLKEILRRLKGHENKNWLFTNSGIKVFLANPSIDQINIEDIAHAICHLCRYNGQCKKFFSVGEHSCLVAEDILRKTGDRELALAGLMHDSPEAYLCDVTGPLKDMLLVYGVLESRFERVIRDKFEIAHPFNHPIIKKSDYEVFFTEADHLFDFPYLAWGREGGRAPVKIEGQRPEQAKKRFLQMANDLGFAT